MTIFIFVRKKITFFMTIFIFFRKKTVFFLKKMPLFYLIFNVIIENTTQISVTIQNLTAILLSWKPFF